MDTIRLKQKIKDSSWGNMARQMAIPYFWIQNKCSDISTFLRGKDIVVDNESLYLKKWKNSHVGESCFIVATGPSLTMNDLDLLADSGIYSFGMNSCALCLDKTKWIPSLLGVQDEYVYKKIETVLIEESNGKLKDKIWVSDNVSTLCPSSKQFLIFKLHYLDHKYNPRKMGELKFSENCYNVIYDGYSIIFSILQLAIYMGFKAIYLLGTDCNYNQPKQHFIDNGTIDPNRDILGNKLIYTHSKFKEFADKHGVKVVNCTRGGMLEVYPRMRLENVLGIQ